MSQPRHWSVADDPYWARESKSAVTVSNDELATVRDAMRSLNHMVEQLQAGERKQFVLMKRGRMVARIVPIPENP